MNQEQTSVLARLYNESTLSVDKLPYTAEFDVLVADYNRHFAAGHHQLFRELVRLRKNGKLLRKSKSRVVARGGTSA